MRTIILFTLSFLFSHELFAQNSVKTESPACAQAELQLKRVQSFLKKGEKEKWGRNLVDYQNDLFIEVDKQCFPETGVAASKKQKKIIKKGSPNTTVTVKKDKDAQAVKKVLKHHNLNLADNQVAEIGPVGSISKRPTLKTNLTTKAKAWQAWYTPEPECRGNLDIKMFVYCNKLEKAQKADFDKLWANRNNNDAL